jgi:hypothetical protein
MFGVAAVCVVANQQVLISLSEVCVGLYARNACVVEVGLVGGLLVRCRSYMGSWLAS